MVIKRIMRNELKVVGLFLLAAILLLPQIGARSDTADQRLLSAVEHSNLDLIKRLLTKGNRSAASFALQVATDDGCMGETTDHPDLSVIRFLLENGADPNKCDDQGASPLMSVSQWGTFDPSAAAMLLRYGARVNSHSSLNDQTALMAAATSVVEDDGTVTRPANVAAIRWLIAHGAAVNARTSDGENAVYFAATTNSPDVTELLIRDGARFDQKDKYGLTPLMYTADFTDDEAFSCLFSTGKVLIHHGADVNTHDADGMTPLMAVVRVNDDVNVAPALQFANDLIAHGARVNDQDNEGETAVFYAASEGNSIFLYLLIKHGASIDRPDKHGKTPLMASASTLDTDRFSERDNLRCWPDFAHVLLERGVPVNAVDDQGMTALMCLGEDYNKEDALVMAKDLIQHGARVDIRDHHGHTAEQIAERYGRTDLAHYLRSVEGRGDQNAH